MESAEYLTRTHSYGTAAGSLLVSRWRAPGLWADKLKRAALVLTAAQVQAARLAEAFTVSQIGPAEASLVPEAFAGMASDGRPLDTLMVGAAVAANRVSGGEFPLLTHTSLGERQAAMDRAAEAWLRLVSVSQVADAARAALRSSMAVRDASGLRVANLPCCPRCAALAGRVYHWSAGFQRHPGCDCTLKPIPGRESVAEDDEIPLDQIRGLSAADRKAVEMGADLQSVVNAQRGMYTADTYGRRVKATFDSTMHRDSKFSRRANPNSPRLRPESILEAADGDPEVAMRLLRRFGYIK